MLFITFWSLGGPGFSKVCPAHRDHLDGPGSLFIQAIYGHTTYLCRSVSADPPVGPINSRERSPEAYLIVPPVVIATKYWYPGKVNKTLLEKSHSLTEFNKSTRVCRYWWRLRMRDSWNCYFLQVTKVTKRNDFTSRWSDLWVGPTCGLYTIICGFSPGSARFPATTMLAWCTETIF